MIYLCENNRYTGTPHTSVTLVSLDLKMGKILTELPISGRTAQPFNLKYDITIEVQVSCGHSHFIFGLDLAHEMLGSSFLFNAPW